MTNTATQAGVEHVLSGTLFVLLVVGNLLALPLWWWLFGTPLVCIWKWVRSVKSRRTARRMPGSGHSSSPHR